MGIACVQWSMTKAGSKAPWFGASKPKIYHLGYFWWMYGDFAGELQYIRFANQVFMVPDHLPDGYGYAMYPGVEGRFHAVFTKLEENPLKVIQNAISMRAGITDGLKKLGITGLVGEAPVVTKTAQNTRLLKAGP